MPAALAGLAGPENLAALDLVGLAARADLVAPAGMNRVAPAVMADTGQADLASPGVRVALVALVALVSLGVPVDLEDMSPVDLAERVLTARERRGREAQVLNPDRAQRDPMPTALDQARPGRIRARPDLTPAGLDRAHRHRMRAHPDPTPVHRLWAATTRAEATRPEARIRLVEATPPVATAPRVEATHRRSGRTIARYACRVQRETFRTGPYDGSRTLARQSVSHRRFVGTLAG